MSETTPRVGEAVILVDIDEVVFPFAHAYDRWLVRTRGHGLSPTALEAYLIAAAAGDGHRENAVRFVNDPDTIANEHPIPGSTEAIRLLSDRYTLIACTSRRSALEGEATRQWLEIHVSGISEVLFTSEDHDSVVSSKASIALKYGAVALIDDTKENLEDLPPGCQSILIRRPEGLASGADSLTWQEALARFA